MLRVVYAILLFLFSQTSHAIRTDVLVVVNDNSVDSPQVGAYYALKRNIDPANVVHIKAPTGHYVTWDEFRSIRDQIIKHIQSNALAETAGPVAGCTPGAASPYADTQYYCQASIDQIRDHSEIRYIVMTRGVPPAINAVPESQLSSQNGTTSLDNYLRYWLVNYFTSDVEFSSLSRTRDFADGRGMRTVDPEQDLEFIIGRIDGLTYESAVALVDRAISAEENGIYGRLFGAGAARPNGLGPMRWKDYSTGQFVYPPEGSNVDGWRYQLGLWNESRPECAAYESNYLVNAASSSTTSDNAPAHCDVVISEMLANETIPGTPSSRAPLIDGNPLAVDAQVYIGNQDGQATGAGGHTNQLSAFDSATNWRRTRDPCSAYCLDDACRLTTADPLGEIDTGCVGVAEGFIGYNLQSFPAAGMFAWPTGWHGPSSGAAGSNLAFPEVRTDSGYSDSRSVWFRQNQDQAPNAACYLGPAAEGATSACSDQKKMRVYQTWALSSPPANGMRFKVRLKARGEGLGQPVDINVSLSADPISIKGGFTGVTGPHVAVASLPAGDTQGWLPDTGSSNPDGVELVISGLQDGVTYANYLRLEITSAIQYAGGIGLDDLEIYELDSSSQEIGPNLAVNSDLQGGFRQVSGGDFPSMFLSRMNGTAFWGSVSHHGSGGASFADGMMERLMYWIRGLPLGDAVWLAEGGRYINSGIFYGDPLYSPVAVMIGYLDNVDDRIANSSTFFGSALNGRDMANVTTSYNVDYCAGKDFFDCDRNNGWLPTGMNGVGGSRAQSLGVWDLTGLPYGEYTMRLAVTSSNSQNGKAQTFNDYYTVKHRYATDELPDYSVTGIVADDLGQVLPGVQVELSNTQGVVATSTTDLEGRYSLSGLSNGDYTLNASLYGYVIAPSDGDPAHTVYNGSSSRDFVAQAQNYVISGQILDSEGHPLPDVVMQIHDNYGFSAVALSNVNGQYQAAGISNGIYIVLPVKQGYSIIANSGNIFQTVSGSNVQKDYTANPQNYSIAGTIQTSTGQPLSGVIISINPSSGAAFNAVTNSNGYYRAPGIPSGLYAVSASKPDYTFQVNSGNIFQSVSSADVLDKDFTATQVVNTYSISGYILENGLPVPGVQVQVNDNYGFSSTVYTDNAGYYSQDGLKNGIYTVYPVLAGYKFSAVTGNIFQTVSGGSIIDKDFNASQTN